MNQLARRLAWALIGFLLAEGTLAASRHIGPAVPVTDLDTGASGLPGGLVTIGDAIFFRGPAPSPSWAGIWRLRERHAEFVAYACDPGSGYMTPLVKLPGQIVVYSADECSWGVAQLWRLDLKTGETAHVESPDAPVFAPTGQVVRVGSRAFVARYPASLWKTDGTDKGTVPVFEFDPLHGSIASEIQPLGSRGVFTASNGDPQQPWVSDGTADGTKKLGEVYPQSIPFVDRTYFSVGDRLVFAGFTFEDGNEIWATDGTQRGTKRLSDLRPGTQDPEIRNVFACDGMTFFTSRGLGPGGEEIGYELWRTDGTRAGTRLVVDLAPGEASLDLTPFGCIGPRVLFWAGNEPFVQELWISDGTKRGTHYITSLAGRMSYPARAFEYHDWLFFPFETTDEGLELWATDGTAEGTFLTGDLRPGPSGSNIDSFAGLGDSLYFTYDDGFHGRQIWRLVIDPSYIFSDGFETGTTIAWREP